MNHDITVHLETTGLLTSMILCLRVRDSLIYVCPSVTVCRAGRQQRGGGEQSFAFLKIYFNTDFQSCFIEEETCARVTLNLLR